MVIPERRSGPGTGFVVRIALAFLFLILTASNLAFFRFENLLGNFAFFLLSLLASGGAALFAWRHTSAGGEEYSLGALMAALCFAAAILLCLLGGEGRLFYANVDWQVRDPLYHDLVVNSWPFKYSVAGHFLVLRAPLGMYLLPAMASKVIGQRFEGATLLVQNSLVLGCLLCVVAAIFPRKRQLSALLIFIFFGGMEIVGDTLRTLLTHRAWHPDHIEWWSGISQYSAFITDIFWTPHHAFPGFLAGLLYALWWRRRIALSLLLGAVPLLAYWSPFALIGISPFALYACFEEWRQGEQVLHQLVVPASVGLLSLPALLYLRSAPNGVRWSFGILPRFATPNQLWAILFLFGDFLLLQVGLFLLIVWEKRKSKAGIPCLLLLTIILIFAPLIRVGQGIDFSMRATIPALVILAIEVIESLYILEAERKLPSGRLGLAALTAALILGACTGLFEIKRAITKPPVEGIGCNFVDAWTESPFKVNSDFTYLTPEDAMPTLYRHAQAEVVTTGHPGSCWSGPWYQPH